MGAFEDFVNLELPKRISTNEDGEGSGSLPSGRYLRTTGVGLGTETVTTDTLSGDADHDQLTNTHNLTTDIDHTAIQNIGTNAHSVIDTHLSSTSNPHSVDASDVGLGNVDNVATDDTAYNATSWNTNLDAATKNSIRDKVETMDTAIGLNTAKDTNVSTDLSLGTITSTTMDVNSSDGTNATLISADTTDAGLLTASKFDEIESNTLKDTNVSTNLSEGTSTTTTVDVNSSDGTNATLVSASTTRAGLLTKAKWDEIVANTSKVTNATHTGEVTGDTALTVDKTAITGKGEVTAVGADHVLISDASDAGNLKKVLVSDFAGASGTPGGSDTQVQFNDGGSFGGDSKLVYNKTTGELAAKILTIDDGTDDWSIEIADSSSGTVLDFKKGGVTTISMQSNGLLSVANMIVGGGQVSGLDAPFDDNFATRKSYVDDLVKESKTITIENPTSSENLQMMFTNRAITITEIRAVLVGSTPSVTWTIRHSPDRSAAGNEVVTGGTVTTSTTTGSDVTSFDDATIPADSFIWISTTAQSGTVTQMGITFVANID